MKRLLLAFLIAALVLPLMLAQVMPARANADGTPAYQELVPMGKGSETGLQVFPPKLQVSGKDNWLAVQDADGLDVPVGTYTEDAEGDRIAVDKNRGAIHIDSAVNSLIITAGALSDKCKHDIEITDYTTYGGETVWDVKKGKNVITELRAKFKSNVYGSGSDLYLLENTPQNQETVKREITAVRVYATVEGAKAGATASTKILTYSKKYNGTIVSLSTKQVIVTEYYTNPSTGLPWTWQEIDDLEAGVTLKDGVCYYVFVRVELVVHSQTFFPITPVEIAPKIAAWTDVNVSAYVPSGTTGVVLHIHRSSSSVGTGVRKNGSTDNRTSIMSYGGQHAWAAIGVDASRIFEAYGNYQNVWLIGYTTSGVTFFTNSYTKSTLTAAWTDIDCSAEAPSAIGLIFEVDSSSVSILGFRKEGSSDYRVATTIHHNTFGVIIGCNTSQVCEGYANAAGLYLVGYITEGATFYTNATDVSLNTVGSWTNLTALPSGAVMGFIEVTSSTVYSYGLRKDGSTEEIYDPLRYHPWAFVECSTSGIIEGKISNTGVDFFVVGYATASSGTATITTSAASNIESTTATLNGNVTDTGGENPTVTVYWGDNDGGQVATNWDSNSAPTSPSQPQGVVAFYKDVTGLSAGTTYYFSAKATNSSGTSWASSRDFTTAAGAGIPVITTNPAAGITTTAATLQGTLSSLGDYSPVYVYFQYGLTAAYGASGSPTVEQTKTSTGGFSQSLSDLNPYTSYHFRAVAKYGAALYVYGSDTTFTTTEEPLPGEPGIALPDILRIDDVKVFTGYMTSGDQLYVIAYRIIYYSGTPVADVGDYFDFQLLDGTTLKAQTPVKSWDYRPGSIYLVATSAPVWSGLYTVKIVGNPNKWTSPPECSRTFTLGDWQGSDLTQLDTWVIALAGSLQSYYNSQMVVYSTGGQAVLSEQGGVIFNMGIPGLSIQRPHLFKSRIEYADYDRPTREDKLQPQLNPSERLGPYISDIIEDAGALVEQDLSTTVGWIFAGAFILLAGLIGIFAGTWIVGFAVAAPLVLTGMWIGGIPAAGLMLVAAIVVMFVLKATWLRGI